MNTETREQIAATLNQHHQTTGMSVASGVTCACGYWTGSEPEEGKRPLPWGRDRLDLHRADVVADSILIAITRASEALNDALVENFDDDFWKLGDRKYNSPSEWLDAYAEALAAEATR